MALVKDSTTNPAVTIDSSLDRDVVGLTNLVEFKSDGELYELESGEFRLFGQDGVPLQHNSSFSSNSSGDKEFFLSGSSHHCSNFKQKNKQIKRPRKNKVWNEMEKDLFLKGLELFGENWRKISKFIATKTTNQVKLYHKQWAETASVIPECVNFANDSSIYLPLTHNNDDYFRMDYSTSTDFLEKSSHNIALVNPADSQASVSGTDRDISEMHLVDGIIVSPLHDWNLGSQVSVTEEKSTQDFPLVPLTLDFPDKTPKTRKTTKRNDFGVSKKTSSSQSKTKKGRKTCVSLATKAKSKDSSRNIIRAPKQTLQTNKGQIIHLNNSGSEDSDVNIDDSDSEKSTMFSADESATEKAESEVESSDVIQIDDKNSNHSWGSKNEAEDFKSISGKKRNFDSSLEFKDDDTSQKFISIRSRILEEWDNCKPSILTKNKIITEFGSSLKDTIDEIFDYLEKNYLINSEQGSIKRKGSDEKLLLHRKSNRRQKVNKTKNQSEIMKKGGGLTISHDASGAVIDALYFPEFGSSKQVKRNSMSKHLKLVNCFKYDPDTPPPYRIFLHPQTIIVLDIHCHSSSSEVIGLLGGFINSSESTLYVTTAVPTKASSSGFDCDMCPLSQMNAANRINGGGMAVVGWYHSHPSFLPTPSQRDIDTQSQFQNWFKKSDAPFIGIIVNPFPPGADSESSAIRCFLLDAPPSRHAYEMAPEKSQIEGVPYHIPWDVMQETNWKWAEVESTIQDVLQKSKDYSSPVKWKKHWKNGRSYLDKLCVSLKSLLSHDSSELASLTHDTIMAAVT